MHFQQNPIQFGKYICYNLTDLKILTRKKNGTWAEGEGKVPPKIHTTSNCWKENEKVCNIQNNFDSKKLNNLIKLQSPLNETTIELKKDYKMYLQVECHLSAIIKVNSDKYLTNSVCCSQSYGFFFYIKKAIWTFQN